MKTLNEIKAEISEEINKSLINKGYNTAKPITLNPDDEFIQEINDYYDEDNASYYYGIEVTVIKSSKHGIRITGANEDGVNVSRRMSELSIEQLYELYNSVKKLPNCDVED